LTPSAQKRRDNKISGEYFLNNITLICTVHKEQGLCTSEKLENIIGKINPDVIFEELHPENFDLYYKEKTFETLETNSISNYIKYHKIDHIPVDNYDINSIFECFKNINYMFNIIEDSSSEILELMEIRAYRVALHGFTFLNSQDCINLHSEIERIRKISLININSAELLKIFKSWIDMVDSRENKMLKNIYSFCNKHEVNSGLFLVGAEHRKTLIEKFKCCSHDNEISWNYENYNGIL
jgi:hypothetical protein